LDELNPETNRAIRQLRRKQAVEELVGRSPLFLQTVEQLPAVARGAATVLITGETGTGKELVARAIHHLSPRDAFPFIPVNCGSLQDTLLEDELFGHTRGAFTDATAHRTGLLAQADGGTLFLDEVENLTPRAQVALLRVLQDKILRPLGSNLSQRVDVRFVAATNVALESLMLAGRFRPDLYYRLCVISLHLPRLCDRPEDILLLAHHFLDKHGPLGQEPRRLTAAAEAALETLEWPGNVRELENAIVRGLNLARGEWITPADLGLPERNLGQSTAVADGIGQPLRELKRNVVNRFERDYLTRLLSAHGGNVTQAAHAAGKDRRELGKLMKKHQLHSEDFRAARSARPGAKPRD
jgi:DNA-binding NtrC family response regulator